MTAYKAVLPECFPYLIRGPVHAVENIINILLKAGQGAPNGSSFAITSDAPSGYRCVWLSEASYRTLLAVHIVPGLYPVTTTGKESFADFVLAGGHPVDYKGDVQGPADWAELQQRRRKGTHSIRPHMDHSVEDLARINEEAEERRRNGL